MRHFLCFLFHLYIYIQRHITYNTNGGILRFINLIRNEECIMRRIAKRESHQKMTEGIPVV